MEVTLLYIPDCPNWQVADAHLRALAAEHPDLTIRRRLVTTAEEAARLGFRGSPTVLVDGADPFDDPGAPTGLSCRLYRTPDGVRGAPTLAQLRAALTSAR